MIIPVFSGNLDTQAICVELCDSGLVIIETNRTHAQQLASEVATALGINAESYEGPSLIHQSIEVDDQGWTDFFIYSKVYDYEPRKTGEMVRIAIRSWINAGSPDTHHAKVHY